MENIFYSNNIKKVFSILILLSFSCTKEKLKDDVDVKHPKQINDESLSVIIENDSTQIIKTKTRDELYKNLYGRFFCDRAEFYVIEDPSIILYKTKPKSVTHYYLDGELKQTKYEFSTNIIKQLVKDFGSFKIVGFDEKNKSIITGQQVLVNNGNVRTLNPSLDNFEVRWIVGDQEIRYRVNSSTPSKYTYTERNINYEKEFIAIEKFCV
ncbi:MAG: hypothetical protein O9340_10715 [Cyclobacteriaceae bacterium]|jgi:hypothetical protein|nr:hypothetical protein [Cyclobacteriaceae bacterium]